MSSIEDKELGAVALPVKEGFKYLWSKSKESLKYLYKNHQFDGDWFYKADVDTFAIMSNLRHFLSKQNKYEELFFGMLFKGKESPQGFAGGGAGYIMSRKTLQKVVEIGLPDSKKCSRDSAGLEDVELAKCLYNIGIPVTDTRDENGAMRMMPYMPRVMANETKLKESAFKWFGKETKFHPVPKGLRGLSASAISFHYVPPEMMYELEFFFNKLKIYGRD